jgi:hypothetical protein
MTKHPDRLWIVAILLGWAFDFLFWEQSAGINFAIFMSVALLGGIYLLFVNGLKPARNDLPLIAAFAVFAFITTWRQEPLTVFLAYTFTLLSLGLLTVSCLGGRWAQYSLLDYLFKFTKLLVGTIVLPLMFFFHVREERAERGEAPKKLRVMPVVRGLVIAVPVVAVFAGLLTSADLVFNQKLLDFFLLFNLGRLSEYVLRLLLILFWAYLLAGVFLHAAEHSQDEKLAGEEKPVIKPFVGFTETSIVLGSVTILFFLFVMVQFQYFFGGNANIGVEGFTYSQYARRGFNELIIVAFFSLLMVLGLGTITKRENSSQRWIFSGLSATIVAFVLVILVSAFQRITLANDWHGFSRLRLYPQIFLVWLGILFVAVVALEILRRERYFPLAALLASFGFAISLWAFNVDRTIVIHNVIRATQGKHFNVAHLASLSADAVPAMGQEFLDPTVPEAVHDGIGAALICYQNIQSREGTPSTGWRSFNYSRWLANMWLASLQSQLQPYHVSNAKGPAQARVRTPGNVFFECWGAED